MPKIKVKHPVTGKFMWVEESELSDAEASTPAPPKPPEQPAHATTSSKKRGDFLFDDHELEEL